jgi:HPt (histidine-containing phosphotransfer) domain-containing protein
LPAIRDLVPEVPPTQVTDFDPEATLARCRPPSRQSGSRVLGGDFDLAAALARCGDDVSLLRELIDMNLSEFPIWLRDLEAAVDVGDAAKVKKLAHTLKGAFCNYGTDKDDPGPCWTAALRLELLGRDGRTSEFRPAWVDLSEVFCTLVSLFNAIRSGESSEEMAALAQKWAASRPDSGSVGAPPPEPEAVFDEAEALAKVGGDRALLKLMIDLFIADEPGFLSRIRELIACNDGKALAGVAEDFAGRIGAFSASGIKAARRLAALARNGAFAEAEQALTVLNELLCSLMPALGTWSSVKAEVCPTPNIHPAEREPAGAQQDEQSALPVPTGGPSQEQPTAQLHEPEAAPAQVTDFDYEATLARCPPLLGGDVNLAGALARCWDDTLEATISLLRELIDMFTTELPIWLRDLEGAVNAGDSAGVARLAHTIEGALCNFGTDKDNPGPSWTAARLLRDLGRDGRVSEFRSVLVELNRASSTLVQLLLAIRSGKSLEEMAALAHNWAADHPEAGVVAASQAEPEAVFDVKEALAKVGGDRTLLKKMIDLFIADEPGFLSRIRELIACNDGKALAGVALDFAGRVGAFSRPGFKAARRLEGFARNGDFAGAEQGLAALTNLLGTLMPALATWSRVNTYIPPWRRD